MHNRFGVSLLSSCCVFCLGVMSITPACSAQTSGYTRPVQKPAPPIAYVYVSQAPTIPGPNQVIGFAAAPTGLLTPIAGSPFQADVNRMAVNGKYLFGGTTDELYLNAYTIEKDGALTFAVANDIGKMTGGVDIAGSTIFLTLDHSGATLYDLRLNGDGSDNGVYETYVIDKATGAMTSPPGFSLGTGNNMDAPGAFTFSANDKYMYGVHSGWAGYDVQMSLRASSGALLVPPAATPPIPRPVDTTGYRFNPIGISADPSNHVAVAFANEEGNMGPEIGPNQLGVYTANSGGILTTTCNYTNMPQVAVGDVTLKMAPSGKLLAAFGSKGLQVFHFNGGDPITAYKTLVENVDFEGAFWDNNNHLFAVSQKTGRLYVFTVTPTSSSQAPGAPYSIPGAQSLIVQPLR